MLFGFVAIALIGSGAALYTTIEASRTVRAQVQVTSRTLANLRDVLRAATDAETGQRGYVITGEAAYLAPYSEGRAALPVALDALNHTLGDAATARQRDSLEALRVASARKLDELAETVALVEAGRTDEARAIVDTDEGLELMREIRAIVLELETIEEEALARSVARSDATQARTLPLLAFLAVFLLLALSLGLWQIVRTAQAEAKVRDIVEVRRARERADLLARELNHRVKNLFAVITSIANTTLRSETDTATAAKKVQQRIRALAVAHEVSAGTLEQPIVDLRELVEATLAPYDQYAERLQVTGVPVEIPTQSVTPLGLVLHELATNTVKYGAWASMRGRVIVSWEVIDGSGLQEGSIVRLRWCEDRANAPSSQGEPGFGTRMMKMAAAQLGGRFERSWLDDGVDVVLEFPLPV